MPRRGRAPPGGEVARQLADRGVLKYQGSGEADLDIRQRGVQWMGGAVDGGRYYIKN